MKFYYKAPISEVGEIAPSFDTGEYTQRIIKAGTSEYFLCVEAVSEPVCDLEASSQAEFESA